MAGQRPYRNNGQPRPKIIKDIDMQGKHSNIFFQTITLKSP